MAKREKKVIYTKVSKQEMEQAFAEYAMADAQMAKINNELEEEFEKLRQERAAELSKLSGVKEKSFNMLQSYAVENRSRLFSSARTLFTKHGSFGFRYGTPKLKTTRGNSWETVTEQLKKLMPNYVRIVVEPAKDLIIANRDNPEVNSFFDKVGICVDKDETFFVKRYPVKVV